MLLGRCGDARKACPRDLAEVLLEGIGVEDLISTAGDGKPGQADTAVGQERGRQPQGGLRVPWIGVAQIFAKIGNPILVKVSLWAISTGCHFGIKLVPGLPGVGQSLLLKLRAGLVQPSKDHVLI